MIKIVLAVLLLSTGALAQVRFDVKNASKTYDVRIEVEKCDNKICEGKVTYTLFKKNQPAPFQVFKLDDTSFMLGDDDEPSVNVTRLYDEQSAVSFGDYNFDGIEDLALCDGKNSGYGMPSYQIYLFSSRAKRFVNNPFFTELTQGEGLGMFEVDAKKKVLGTFSKSGCCWHVTREFAVINDRPRKVLEIVEDATIANEKKVKITTSILVNGRWRRTVKYVPRVEQ
ncbi:MAG TPA: hypothetical protein VIF81_08720 [Pyrinomonadaceae bacterium]|jgi:hypothetical protein